MKHTINNQALIEKVFVIYVIKIRLGFLIRDQLIQLYVYTIYYVCMTHVLYMCIYIHSHTHIYNTYRHNNN